MNKNDRLFCVSILMSLILIGLIMMDNSKPSPLASVKMDSISQARQKILDMKLPLHEGKYWRKIE